MATKYIPIGRREFAHNNLTYVYDYEELGLGAVCTAKALFEYYNEILIHPPRSKRELEVAGGDEYVLRCMSYVLLLKQPHGLEQVTPESVHTFLTSLPSKHLAMLEDCRTDFFFRAKIQNVARMKDIARSLDLVRAAASLSESRRDSAAPASSPNDMPEITDVTSPPNTEHEEPREEITG